MASTVLFIAHGSRAQAANDAHAAMAATLAERTGAPVVAAFLELAEPSIPDGIDRAIESGADEVLVLPHFLYPGRHLVEDIPRLVAEGAARHPDASITMLEASGAQAAMVDLLSAQIEGHSTIV